MGQICGRDRGEEPRAAQVRDCTPRVWRIPGRAEFPEVAEGLLPPGSLDVGLALSGGGIRASSQSLGVLKALHAKGYLGKVRYISSNSGSGWVNAPLSFLPDSISLDTFLGGPPLEPSKLDVKTLENPPAGSFADAAGKASPTRDYLKGIWQDWWGKGHLLGAWNEACVKCYLEPFGLHDPASPIAPPVGTSSHKAAVAATVKHPGNYTGKGKVTALRKGAAYPIFCATRLQHGAEEGGDWGEVELTPLYCGTPSIGKSKGAIFGGGVIENFGFGTPPPASLPGGRTEVQDGERVQVTPPVKYASLAFVAGTSSSAPYLALAASFERNERLGGASMPLWSPVDIKSENNRDITLADGGSVDNVAMLPLLRRGVKTIICHIAGTTAITAPDIMKEAWWPSLFGRCQDKEELNVRTQVFESDKWDDLFTALKKQVSEGQPPIVEQTLNVLANEVCGVAGGYQVRVMWCVDGITEKFRSALPADTQELLKVGLKKGIVGNLMDAAVPETVELLFEDKDIDSTFPFDTTYMGNYKPRLVMLLAENEANNLLEKSDILDEIFAK